jgi:hypothetical protein
VSTDNALPPRGRQGGAASAAESKWLRTSFMVGAVEETNRSRVFLRPRGGAVVVKPDRAKRNCAENRKTRPSKPVSFYLLLMSAFF